MPKDKKAYIKNSIYANIKIQTSMGRTRLVNGKPEPEPLFVDLDTITLKIEEDSVDKAIEILKGRIKEATECLTKAEKY